MKQKWEVKRFEDCIKSISYPNKIKKIDFLVEGKYPIISQEEEPINGYWNNSNDIFKVDKAVVIFGDHTRVLKFVDFDFVLGADGVKILDPIAEINTKYFYYYLKWVNVPDLGYSRHYKLLKEICVPVPPMEVQEAIVKELDTLHLIKEKQDEQLAQYDNLAQSTFYSMFGDPIDNEKGWEVRKLGEVANCHTGVTYKPENVSEDGEIVLRSGNIQNLEIDLSKDIVRINKKISDKYKVKDNDILMCSCNGSARLVGKCAKIKNLPQNTTFGAFMTIIRSEYFEYLYAFFNTDGFRSQLTTSGTTTINQITQRMLREILLPLPPLSLQEEFAERIEHIEAQKELLKKSIADTQLLIDYTMDKYFG